MVRSANLHVVNARVRHFAITPLVTAIMDVRKIGWDPDVTVSKYIKLWIFKYPNFINIDK